MRWVRKILQILHSTLVWTLSFTWMAILSIATAILIPFFSYRRVHLYVPAAGFSLIPRFTLSSLRATFDPKFDPKRLSVFCFNHVNVLDGFVTSATIPHAFCGVMNAWHFYIPFYGWLMRMSKGIGVHRRSGQSIQEEITKEAKRRKEVGFSSWFFPRLTELPMEKFTRFTRACSRWRAMPDIRLCPWLSAEVLL